MLKYSRWYASGNFTVLSPDASAAVFPADIPVPFDVASSADRLKPVSDVVELKINSPGT